VPPPATDRFVFDVGPPPTSSVGPRGRFFFIPPVFHSFFWVYLVMSAPLTGLLGHAFPRFSARLEVPLLVFSFIATASSWRLCIYSYGR